MSRDGASNKISNHGLLPIGKVVAGRYVIESVIGEGAQSVVYRASRRPTSGAQPVGARARGGDQVALKVIHRHLCGSEQVKRRFHREADILGRLEGENIVKLLEFIEEDDLLMIALEHVEGTSLEALLEEKGALPVDVAVEIALQVCAALGAAHAAGVIHRDLKPANVLVERAQQNGVGPGVRVKVVDFGLARVVQGDSATTNLTHQGMIFGTPEYMAPEQARGDEADGRSDIYATGVMLYEMAVGEVPFKGRSAVGAMAAHLSEAPPSPRANRRDGAISTALEAVILRALAKNPDERYPKARILAEALVAARDQARVIAPTRISDPDAIATSDTDLHLPAPASTSFTEAKTMPAHQMSPAIAAALARTEAHTPVTLPENNMAVPVQPERPAPKDAPGTGDVGPTLRSLDGAVAYLENPPAHRSRWLWVLVAVVAAAVGVVIGALAGAR